jgi:putative peptidoglycan lipid II flippase
MTAVLPEERAPEPESGLLRSTAAITAGNVTSRVTGFVRVLAVGAALGTTFAGNTYQTANLVSNILFELLAAGLLSSVLVPGFVRLLDRGRRQEAEHVAGALLGVCLAALGVVLVAGLLLRPVVMRVLTLAVSSPEIRRQEVRLGAFFLWFFLPQLLLYAVGAVATALLYGTRRFGASAFAPVANNVLVTATMGLFWWMRRGGEPGLNLPLSQRLVLAIGTSAGVLAMTAIPVVAAWRAGLRLRPRWDLRHPDVRALGRPGAWAAAYLALSQVLIAVTLVLANRVEGGVVAFQIAFTFFLLPHAILAQPVYTALYPSLSSDAHAQRWRRFSDSVGGGIRLVGFLVFPATALLVALAHPLLRVMQLGALDSEGVALVARVVAAYALGLIGYTAFQLLTRASYAAEDTRTPTLVNLGATLGGAALMVLWFSLVSGGQRVVVLGFAHSVAMVIGAAALYAVLRRRIGRDSPITGALVRSMACGVVAGLLARALADVLGDATRGEAALTVAVAGTVAAAVYLAIQWALRAPELRGIGLRAEVPGP